MNRWIRPKVLLPIAVLLLGAVTAAVIVAARPQVERTSPQVPPPLVRVIEVAKEDLTLKVRAQGTVQPLIESTLVAQVAGRIDSVSPDFAEGGFFRRGQILLQIDDRDYRLAVARAEARVAQSRVRLELETAEAELARQEWKELGRGEATPLTLREPQLAEAEAGLEAARAELAQARLDLERTAVRALFDGRLRSKRVDVGQFVTVGSPLGTVYSTHAAEIRLPVSRHDLAHLEIGLGVGGIATPQPEVLLTGELAGRRHLWSGRIVRSGSEFDPKTRMLPLFARVEDPFRRRAAAGGTPLPMGLFVEAEIRGRQAAGVVPLPRSAMRSDDQVLVVDDESRLRFRTVDLLRREKDRVLVSAGLDDGELVCVSPIETVVDGMRVRTAPAEPSPAVSLEKST